MKPGALLTMGVNPSFTRRINLLRWYGCLEWYWIENETGQHTAVVMEGIAADVVEAALARGARVHVGVNTTTAIQPLTLLKLLYHR